MPFGGGGGGGGGGERQRDEAVFATLFPVNGKVSGEYCVKYVASCNYNAARKVYHERGLILAVWISAGA